MIARADAESAATVERWFAVARMNDVAKKVETRASHAKRQGQLTAGDGMTNQSGPSVSTNIAGVMACIRAHESGNYSEHSHLRDGSGAYQFVPDTWRVWSARAGYPGYQYAYEAPSAVQDAVTAYALTHGGAGNWSVRYGADPCTAGLPGGG